MESRLKEVTAELNKAVALAVEKTGHYMHNQARRRAPRKTGRYQQSIEVKVIHQREATVAQVGSDDFRVNFLELGTAGHKVKPGLRKALSGGGLDHPLRGEVDIPAMSAKPHLRPAGKLAEIRLKKELMDLGLKSR